MLRRLMALACVLILVFFAPAVVRADSGEQDGMLRVLIGSGDARAPRLVRHLGGTVEQQFSLAPVIAASIPAGARDVLLRFDYVRFVEEDVRIVSALDVYDRAATADEAWALPRILGAEDLQDLWEHGDGEGVGVALLDTGAPDGEVPAVAASFLASGPSGETDEHGQGTRVAEVVAGIAPGVDLYAARIMNEDGVGRVSSALAALDWAMGREVRIIQLGFSLRGDSRALEEACAAAAQTGILLVAGTGDMGPQPDTVTQPAAYDSVLAVSAATEDDDIAHWSSWGREVELSAPGQRIVTPTADGGYTAADGPALASAHVAGAAALMFSVNPDLASDGVREILTHRAEDLQFEPERQGAGRLRLDRAVAHAAATLTTGTLRGQLGFVDDEEEFQPLAGGEVDVVGTLLRREAEEDGSFVLEGVPAGEGTLRLFAPDHYLELEFALREDEEKDLGEIHLQYHPIHRVWGYVYDGDAERPHTGLERVTVRVDDTDIRTETDADGWFELDVPAGTRTLTAAAPGFLSDSKEVEVAVDDLYREFYLSRPVPGVRTEFVARVLPRELDPGARWLLAYLYPPTGYDPAEVTDIRVREVRPVRMEPDGGRVIALFAVSDLLDAGILRPGRQVRLPLTMTLRAGEDRQSRDYRSEDVIRVLPDSP